MTDHPYQPGDRAYLKHPCFPFSINDPVTIIRPHDTRPRILLVEGIRIQKPLWVFAPDDLSPEPLF